MAAPDPFILFRSVLFAALAVYTVVSAGATAWRVAVLLRGNDPRKRLLREYLSYQMFSFRVRPLADELIQIAILCGMLLLIWWAHVRMT